MPDKDEVFFSVPDITIIGEPVTMGSLAAVIEQKYGKRFSCSVRWRSQRDFCAREMKPSVARKPWKKS